MTDHKATVHTIHSAKADRFGHPLVGEIRAVDEEGRASVVFAGCNDVPVAARSVVATPWRAGEDAEGMIGTPVLLVLEEADPSRPIIVGLIRDTLRPDPVRQEVSLDVGANRDVLVDGQRLVFDAGQEVVIRCGKGSIVMQRSGKVVIRGTSLTSRSSGNNKIKGASIALN